MPWSFDVYQMQKEKKREFEKERVLQTLKEALKDENYEACTGLIALASDCGAHPIEISQILSEYCCPEGVAVRAV